MRRLAFLLLFCVGGVALTSGAGANTPPPDYHSIVPVEGLESVLTMQVDSVVSIDTNGGLTDFRMETPVPDSLRNNLDRIVRQWRFIRTPSAGPVMPINTRMRITLSATKLGEKYQIRVDNVIFTGDEKDPGKPAAALASIAAKRLVPPQYPIGLERLNIGGLVLLGLKVGNDGRVEDVVAVQTILRDVSGAPKVLGQAVATLEQSALRAARTWRFEVPAGFAKEDAGHHTITVPIVFLPSGSSEESVPGQWRTEVRGQRREMDWLKPNPELQRIGASDTVNGEVLPLASSIRLETDVVGTVIM
ncbi:MAG TPA: hypothetical protein VKM35_03500 [Arenimonas sp.]|uniref:hypothetical protein n=1 Tax=Arenimonas sp. TaxID=1872635 RepID=UPI002BE2A2C7|nr:hypothetical protein [Arenimonas sp.]HMB56254.1 hypothetical protein [Arenimonas sp.]